MYFNLLNKPHRKVNSLTREFAVRSIANRFPNATPKDVRGGAKTQRKLYLLEAVSSLVFNSPASSSSNDVRNETK
eukprot:2951537-Amphidinium_carterae.1